MRRLTIESGVDEVGKFLDAESIIGKVELFETISILREESNEWSIVCRVKMKNSALTFEECFVNESASGQLLENEKNGSKVYFLKTNPNSLASNVFATGCYFSLPLEIKNGKIKASFLGTSLQIKRLLQLIRKLGFQYRIVAVFDATFSPTSPLGLLTEKQREVLITAYKLGYYDIPKKVNTDQIAEKLHIRGPTAVRHREKAEKRLLSTLLSETSASSQGNLSLQDCIRNKHKIQSNKRTIGAFKN
jgi:predicted DNA binding protein